MILSDEQIDKMLKEISDYAYDDDPYSQGLPFCMGDFKEFFAKQMEDLREIVRRHLNENQTR
jgi:hypothetical protein